MPLASRTAPEWQADQATWGQLCRMGGEARHLRVTCGGRRGVCRISDRTACRGGAAGVTEAGARAFLTPVRRSSGSSSGSGVVERAGPSS